MSEILPKVDGSLSDKRFWLALLWTVLTLVPPIILNIMGIWDMQATATWLTPLLALDALFMKDYFDAQYDKDQASK